MSRLRYSLCGLLLLVATVMGAFAQDTDPATRAYMERIDTLTRSYLEDLAKSEEANRLRIMRTGRLGPNSVYRRLTNYEENRVSATVITIAPTRRPMDVENATLTAMREALRQLQEAALDLKPDGIKSLREQIEEGSFPKTEQEIRQFVVEQSQVSQADTRDLPYGGAEVRVTLQIPLTRSWEAAEPAATAGVLPSDTGEATATEPEAVAEPKPTGKLKPTGEVAPQPQAAIQDLLPLPEPESRPAQLPSEAEMPLEALYTGIILDATQAAGKPYSPAMHPVVVAEGKDGTERVYDATMTDPGFRHRGIVAFASSVEKAQTGRRYQSRLGNQPLVIPVERISERNELVISPEDAARIRALDTRRSVLREARVVVVLR